MVTENKNNQNDRNERILLAGEETRVGIDIRYFCVKIDLQDNLEKL